MTRDEIRVESFNRISVALNEVFPGIQSHPDGDTLSFDGGIVKIVMSSADFYDGYFDIISEDTNPGSLWGIKPIVSALITEICRVRKQKILKTLH